MSDDTVEYREDLGEYMCLECFEEAVEDQRNWNLEETIYG